MSLIAWTEIEGFHNIRKFTKAYPENLQGQSVVTYRGKVKLHGTNAGIQRVNGVITAQSRTNIITPENDNAGFARWVKSTEADWEKATKSASMFDDMVYHANLIFFGEWIGPGIQKGVAVSEIPKKCFAVFAARVLDKDGNPSDEMIVNPNVLTAYVKDIPDTYVLPWYGETIDVNWEESAETLGLAVNTINQWVEAVETNDPWVEETFNVKGTGEGLVFYPISNEHFGYANFANLVFKAKGEKHKNIKSAAPAQVDASAAASVNQFVDMVLTEARLEQGAVAVSGSWGGGYSVDIKLVGKFIAWVISDVEKETQDELAASNLTWKQVSKPVGDKARAWYLAKAKQL